DEATNFLCDNKTKSNNQNMENKIILSAGIQIDRFETHQKMIANSLFFSLSLIWKMEEKGNCLSIIHAMHDRLLSEC
ncbi:hypothetical protein ACJX0J_037850, partial [Zea mays]